MQPSSRQRRRRRRRGKGKRKLRLARKEALRANKLARYERRVSDIDPATPPPPSPSLVPSAFDPFAESSSSSSPSPIPLTSLPAEVVSHLSNFLPDVSDVFSLMMTCHAIREQVFLDAEIGTYCCQVVKFVLSPHVLALPEAGFEVCDEREEEGEETIRDFRPLHQTLFLPFVHCLAMDVAMNLPFWAFVARAMPNVHVVKMQSEMKVSAPFDRFHWDGHNIDFDRCFPAKRSLNDTLKIVSEGLPQSFRLKIAELELKCGIASDVFDAEDWEDLKLRETFPFLRKLVCAAQRTEKFIVPEDESGSLHEVEPVLNSMYSLRQAWRSRREDYPCSLRLLDIRDADEVPFGDLVVILDSLPVLTTLKFMLKFDRQEALPDLLDLGGPRDNLRVVKVGTRHLPGRVVRFLLRLFPCLRKLSIDEVALGPLPWEYPNTGMLEFFSTVVELSEDRLSSLEAMVALTQMLPVVKHLKVVLAHKSYASLPPMKILPPGHHPLRSLDLRQRGTCAPGFPVHTDSALSINNFNDLLEFCPSLLSLEVPFESGTPSSFRNFVRTYPGMRHLIFIGMESMITADYSRLELLLEWPQLMSVFDAFPLLETMLLKKVRVRNFSRKIRPTVQTSLKILKIQRCDIHEKGLAFLADACPNLDKLDVQVFPFFDSSRFISALRPHNVKAMRFYFVVPEDGVGGREVSEKLNIVLLLKRFPCLEFFGCRNVREDSNLAESLLGDETDLAKIPLRTIDFYGFKAGCEGFCAFLKVFHRSLRSFTISGWKTDGPDAPARLTFPPSRSLSFLNVLGDSKTSPDLYPLITSLLRAYPMLHALLLDFSNLAISQEQVDLLERKLEEFFVENPRSFLTSIELVAVRTESERE